MTKQSRELTDESNTIRIDQLWASTAQRVSDSDGPKPFNSSEIEDTNSATNKKRPKPSTKNISVGNALKIRQWNPEYQREATNIPSSAWEQYRDTISHWHNHGFTKQMIREQLNFLGFNATYVSSEPTVHSAATSAPNSNVTVRTSSFGECDYGTY